MKEKSFPIKVYDEKGNLIGTSLANSWGEAEMRGWDLCGTLPSDWTVEWD